MVATHRRDIATRGQDDAHDITEIVAAAVAASGVTRGIATVLVAAMSTRAGADGLACDALAKLTLPNATITSAQFVAAGQFTPPGANAAPPGNASPFANLPAFCRVAATLAPSADSEIKIEV